MYHLDKDLVNSPVKSWGGKRPALEARRQANDSDVEYRRYVQHEEQDPAGPPDVLLDVPELKVDSIHFELDDLDAHVALKAKVLNLVKLNVGVDVRVGVAVRVGVGVQTVIDHRVKKAQVPSQIPRDDENR